MLSTETASGMAGCDGAPAVTWTVGVENKDVIPVGDLAVVLDRVGSGEGVDPNRGLARLVNRGGVLADRSFPTAKNTGFGALDSNTGLLWVNSEGSAELVAYEPLGGLERARIRTGTFLDGLAVDPTTEHDHFVTGRLSNTFMRLEHDIIAASTEAVRWPFSPVVDPGRDLVWVLSQTESTVHGHRRSDLASVKVIDPGLGSNALLSFGSLLLHPKRDSLLLAQSQQDVVVELDPDSGEELGRWSLEGPAIEDPDIIGHLALHADPGGQALLLTRSSDGRFQRLDLSTGELITRWLEPDEAQAATEGNEVDASHLLASEGLVYLGGLAVDSRSLERRPDRDLPVSRLLGVHPETNDHLLGVSKDGTILLEMDRAGTVLYAQPHAATEQKAQTFRVAARQRAIITVRSQHARLCWFGFEQLRD